MTYDFLSIGSGFAGSLTALCLKQSGYRVGIIEKNSHPRFAIGESSTPIADMILRDIASRYDLPWLNKLSRYGSWQEHYPELTCGIKRGFSYYNHEAGKEFSSDYHHSNELLVAASVDDENSDTQWLRSDLDHFLVKQAKEYGIEYYDQTEIQHVQRNPSGNWLISAHRPDGTLQAETKFIIDATGSSAFSEKFFNTASTSEPFETNSRAIYSHFKQVPLWLNHLESNGFKTDDYPYNPDHSALHHILEEGWLWMLRFNDDRLSAGLVLDQNHSSDFESVSGAESWNHIIKKYPTLYDLFGDSKRCEDPGKIIKTGRLQRRLDRMFGDGWAALHHTAGFVDPLHSTGIAHTLSGVEKLLDIIKTNEFHQKSIQRELNRYQKEFFSELELIDLLVTGCYISRHNFELFTAWTMLYFTCTIQYEQQRLSGDRTGRFLSAGHPELSSIVRNQYRSLVNLTENGSTRNENEAFIKQIRENIKPFNIAGLMMPEKRNMYNHTAVKL
ncbi:NAD(P)/FAD-dependent oxidoreductase [Rhodohalobacter sp. SW132]|uniref:NAD(P)/FAD-dependent oxidoreductase n=1 Tax=Rhodohalobacter sp. SW132 TaxID=2293433 RepID=UPI0013147BA0|nr:FAD-dependent oxidoreductase [Rhodohalobacter sp. SW132]